MTVRCHTFSRGDFTLYADRVPAMHGRVSIFTVWQREGARIRRLTGGVTKAELRAFARTGKWGSP
jgi:hypothetical protein